MEFFFFVVLKKICKFGVDKTSTVLYSVYITYKQLWRGVIDLKIYQNSNEPIYKQIATQLREQILTGKLRAGDPLPSIRGLAQDLKISVITTMKAYEELSQEGLVTSSKGKGYYVNAQDERMLKEQHMRQLEQHLSDAIYSARIAGVGLEEVEQTLEALWNIDE